MTVRPGQNSKIGKAGTIGKALAFASGMLVFDGPASACSGARGGGSRSSHTRSIAADDRERSSRLCISGGSRRRFPKAGCAGRPCLAPGTRRSRALSGGARLVWQGKVIEPGQTSAVNRFFGMRLVRAQVYQGPSWLDGQPSLVLDYSQTSRVYANNRDEIRQVAPGLYLGLMYDRTTASSWVGDVFRSRRLAVIREERSAGELLARTAE